MSDQGSDSDYVAARFFVALFAVGTACLFAAILWNIHTGIAYAKIGGPIARLSDPQGFWTIITFQAAGALFFAWQSYRFHRSARL